MYFYFHLHNFEMSYLHFQFQVEKKINSVTHLIGHTDEYREKEDEHVAVVGDCNLFITTRQHLVGHPCKYRHRHRKVVAVRLVEIMARDGGRVNVMFTE